MGTAAATACKKNGPCLLRIQNGEKQEWTRKQKVLLWDYSRLCFNRERKEDFTVKDIICLTHKKYDERVQYNYPNPSPSLSLSLSLSPMPTFLQTRQ